MSTTLTAAGRLRAVADHIEHHGLVESFSCVDGYDATIRVYARKGTSTLAVMLSWASSIGATSAHLHNVDAPGYLHIRLAGQLDGDVPTEVHAAVHDERELAIVRTAGIEGGPVELAKLAELVAAYMATAVTS